MFSALRSDGRRLYDLAREGVVIDRPARTVIIHHLSLATDMSAWDAAAAAPLAEAAAASGGNARAGCAPSEALDAIACEEVPPLPEPYPAGSVTCNSSEFPPLPHFGLDVACGGGTYIRSLIDGLGKAAGTAAHMVSAYGSALQFKMTSELRVCQVLNFIPRFGERSMT